MCEQRHFYAFGKANVGYEPKTFSDSLYRGITSHKSLEVYYKAIQAGKSLDDATTEALEVIAMYAAQPDANYAVLGDLGSRILPRYYSEIAPVFDAGYRVMAVEQTYRLEVPTLQGTMIYPFTPDLILQDQIGRNYVVDHKNLYNFMQPDAVDLAPQIPKYIGALRALGMTVYGGFYNILRWRQVKSLAIEDNFRRQAFTPTNDRVVNAFKQQIKVMERIANLKRGSLEEWQSNVTRVQNDMICKSCSFKAPCITEINGGSSSLMFKVDYNPNSYGYKEESDPS